MKLSWPRESDSRRGRSSGNRFLLPTDISNLPFVNASSDDIRRFYKLRFTGKTMIVQPGELYLNGTVYGLDPSPAYIPRRLELISTISETDHFLIGKFARIAS